MGELLLYRDVLLLERAPPFGCRQHGRQQHYTPAAVFYVEADHEEQEEERFDWQRPQSRGTSGSFRQRHPPLHPLHKKSLSCPAHLETAYGGGHSAAAVGIPPRRGNSDPTPIISHTRPAQLPPLQLPPCDVITGGGGGGGGGHSPSVETLVGLGGGGDAAAAAADSGCETAATDSVPPDFARSLSGCLKTSRSSSSLVSSKSVSFADDSPGGSELAEVRYFETLASQTLADHELALLPPSPPPPAAADPSGPSHVDMVCLFPMTSGRLWLREGEHVLLTSCTPRPPAGSVDGTVRVRNLAFEKRVRLRFTWDGWRTQLELHCAYVAGSSTGLTDDFAFSIPMPPPPAGGLSDGDTLEFCVLFEAGQDSQQFWDNNHGRNFKLLAVAPVDHFH